MVGEERREEDRREGKTRQDEAGWEENVMFLALKLFPLYYLYYYKFSHCLFLILGCMPQDRNMLPPNSPFISSVPLQWSGKIIKQLCIRTGKKKFVIRFRFDVILQLLFNLIKMHQFLRCLCTLFSSECWYIGIHLIDKILWI